MTDRKIEVMGIVNLTDNSYFAESRCLPDGGDCGKEKNVQIAAQAALERSRKLIAEGADIIDIGACSTRPGAEPVGEEEEWRRLEPAVSAIRNEFPDIRISIDTYWASVVEKVYDLLLLEASGRHEEKKHISGTGTAKSGAGAETGNETPEAVVRRTLVINDISAGEDDSAMLPVVGKLGLKYIAMHKRGTPKTMQSLCDYDDVTSEVLRYFDGFAEKADRHGIKEWILDPGFGFAKAIDQNYTLMRDLGRFKRQFGTGCIPQILVGVSRKSMIYKLFDTTPEESLPQTQVLHLKALQCGADILRVHDVAEAVRTVELFRRLG